MTDSEQDKFCILNASAIIRMADEAKWSLWCDTEQTSRILSELMEILEEADSVDMQLGVKAQ